MMDNCNCCRNYNPTVYRDSRNQIDFSNLMIITGLLDRTTKLETKIKEIEDRLDALIEDTGGMPKCKE